MMSRSGMAAALAFTAAALVASAGCDKRPVGGDGGANPLDGGAAGATGAGGSIAGAAGVAGVTGSGGAGGGVVPPCVPMGAFEVRRTSTGYEIEVTDPPDWRCPDAALVCVLRIGDLCFGIHSYAANGHRVYPLTDSQFALLQKGDPVSGYYGNPPSQDLTCAPNPNPAGCALYGFWP
jgi:hypothetical protein